MLPLLLSLAAKGTAVLALGVAATALLLRSSASLRHSVWSATFVALLAVPALDALGPSWHVAVLPHAVSTVVAAPPLPVDATAGPPVSASPSVWTWLGWAWGLGVLTVGHLWIRGFVLGQRLVRASRVVEDRVWTSRLRTAAEASGLRGPVRLRRSEDLRVPVAWGWGPPTVVLPSQSDGWAAPQAEAVLLHELAHLHRRDAWTQAVAQASVAIHWFNPLAWIAYRRFLTAREQACDDAVLQVGAPPTTYASTLVAVARELRRPHALTTSVLPMVGPGELETRVRAILDHRRRGHVGRWPMGAVLAMTIVVGGPLAAFQPVHSVCLDTEAEENRERAAGPASVDTLDVEAASPLRPDTIRQRVEPADPSPQPETRADAATDRAVDETEARNAETERRNAAAEARDAATERRNAAAEARDAATERRNAATAVRNAETAMRNAETERRNALIERSEAASRPSPATSPSKRLPPSPLP